MVVSTSKASGLGGRGSVEACSKGRYLGVLRYVRSLRSLWGTGTISNLLIFSCDEGEEVS